MNKLDFFVYFIYAIKIFFIFSAVIHILLKHKGKENTRLYKNVVYLKQQLVFVFMFCMGILSIYIFNPRNKNNYVNREDIKFLYFLFGFIILIDANWKTYIGDSYLLRTVKEVLGTHNS